MTVSTGELVNAPLLACLPMEARERLAHAATLAELAAGEELFREGDPSGDCYLVLDGQLEVLKAQGTPEASIVGVAGRGEFIGEMGLLNPNGLRTATVRAIAPVRLVRIPMGEFQSLVAQNPSFSCQLANLLSVRLTAARDELVATLSDKNRQLQQAYDDLKAAQDELVAKRALERELLLASEIQRSILPTRPPEFPGYDFGGLMSPALAVGGDFFGWFSVDRERQAIVIGDVMGKGIPAAIFMAQTYALLRASAHAGATPGETLRQVNRLLLDMSDSGLFATVIYGILHGPSGRWDYARAGHELPLLMEGSGATRYAPLQDGMPLGIVDQPILDEDWLELKPGDLLLLYSDGVTDGTDRAGRHFDHRRLEQAVSQARGLAAEPLCQSIQQALADFRGDEPQSDDITLLAARRRNG
ncbi:MAG: cyclic nucleotide-binding domain-containing protein [Methylococcaceae bacterium]|nr:cyclic nucleotide-binding domain-containing protein [Methylococcaceae bacterium]